MTRSWSEPSSQDVWWKYGVVLVLVVVMGWFPFVRGTRVPLLGWVDLFVHEAGHILFGWAPWLLPAIMGNGFQTLVPLVFAATFLLRYRDLVGAAFSTAWAGTTLVDASVYIGDAPFQRLDIAFGSGEHDWAHVFRQVDAMGAAVGVSRFVWFLGLVLFALGVTLLVVGPRLESAVRAGRWPTWPPWPPPEEPA